MEVRVENAFIRRVYMFFAAELADECNNGGCPIDGQCPFNKSCDEITDEDWLDLTD